MPVEVLEHCKGAHAFAHERSDKVKLQRKEKNQRHEDQPERDRAGHPGTSSAAELIVRART